jgi:glycosyltransferase involved in cell wall biosynthesis
MPEVSVVIPAYNAEGTIGETLESVLAQTFDDFEVLVIDDGSTDGTYDVSAATSDDRVRVLSGVNGGVARARNRGLEASAGQLVAFLDADDLWKPTKLARQVEVLASHEDIGVCFPAAVRIDADGKRLRAMPTCVYPDYCEALLLYSMIVPASCSSVMLRRGLALELGGFDPALSQAADWDFSLRLSRIAAFAAIEEELVMYRTHAGQMSNDIRLLERDTFAVLHKFFADPASQPYLPLRSRVYSNHWMICSGSYLHAGQVGASLRCLMRGLRAYPPNVRRPLGLPWRWMSRLGRTKVSPV